MSLTVKNTKDLIDPNRFKLKVLIYGLPGSGKSLWASQAPNPGIAACETGEGRGLLTVAQAGLEYVEPASLPDFEAVCAGQVFKGKETIVIDSLSDMCKTFIKDYALTIPRKQGDSPRRQLGVPELDDYGTMGELTRRLLRKVLALDKHIVVTATLRIDRPDAETGVGDFTIGPDLPGQMFLGSTAMFDSVFCLLTRPALRDPKDAKSRYTQRILLTENDGTRLAKCRSVLDNRPLLEREIVWDLGSGAGGFMDILGRITRRYAERLGRKDGT